ncbi:MAG: hydrogenase maturation nickel metallochaperone HypA [Gemmatimonadetes bacterium]|nr:hydrogenase maturation nickel metallochaperone HypA [Gemmatimonadota bacterium]
MLSRARRCLACDYTWSRYLDFPTCPRCGTNVREALVSREKGRLKRVVAVSIVIGVVISILSEFLSLLW